MGQFYKILKADPLGEPWTPSQPGAKPIQNWWCQVDGEEWAVSIGKQVGNSLHPGQHVYGNLMKARSQKGTDYWKFKSEQVPEGVQRPADTPAQATAQSATGAQQFAEEWAGKQELVGGVVPGWFIPFGNILIELQKDMKLLKGDDIPEDPTPEPDPVVEPASVEPAKGVEQIGGEPIDEETQKTLDDIFTPPETAEDASEKEA